MSSHDIPVAPLPAEYLPDEIVLYGVRLNDGRGSNQRDAALPFNKKMLHLSVKDIKTGTIIDIDEIAMVVVYGYAFEGHCYHLDKPRIFIFEYGSSPAPAAGCGFDGLNMNYRMWRITARDILLEIGTNVGLGEELILEANLPGRRAPNTYGNDMQLGHRGGRLNRGGSSV